MKIIKPLIIISLSLFVTACYCQNISLSCKKVSLEKTFKEIKKQTGYSFVYTREQINHSNPVTIKVRNVSLKEALDICFENQPLEFIIDDRYVIVKDKPYSNDTLSVNKGIDIKGKVLNDKNEPLIGTTVTLKGTGKATVTDDKGEFTFSNLKPGNILLITIIGYQPQQISIGEQTSIIIKLQTLVSILDETIIKGYYTTSKRLNTGSVSKVSAHAIGMQPVSNPLAALQGLVPGLQITQDNGLPGTNFTVRIRGQNSIQSGNSPLYIIDGVPFLNDEEVLTQHSYINANSPFNTIVPSDIESIEVLKDADATAIYGSRGANGVILITTKKDKPGKTTLDVNVNNGWGKVTRTIKLMNTSQYLEMRHEAFQNDQIVPDLSNAYDFLAWDSTRYTDLNKLLIGNTAHITNASLRITGGNEFTNFSIATNYYQESTVFPGNNMLKRGALNLSLTHISLNKKFNVTVKSSLAMNNSNLMREDLTKFINLPPLIPQLYDSSGKLNWSQGNFFFINPLANLFRTYDVITDRLTTGSLMEYQLFPEFKMKLNLGYNLVSADETDKLPISSQNPAFKPLGSAFFAKNEISSLIFEPQLEYNKTFLKKSKVEILLGCTFQEKSSKESSISATGYTNDNLPNSTIGATSVNSQLSSQLYHYDAIFGRINYNFSEKYLFNLAGRRDGSSRFGPNKQFANFWAIGAAWIFSSEKYFKDNLPLLSFGKLRGSFGTTGNDLIGNYNYLDLYSQTNYPYEGGASLFPARLFNSDYSWEVIKKLNLALELGLFKNKILLTTEWFKNKSSNQIINYSLPSQTGFNTVLKNFPGVVQNSGFEFSLLTRNVNRNNISWSTTFNITTTKNKLLDFPNLKTSSYAGKYIIGKPLNAFIGARYLGVDPQTGVYQYLDKEEKPTSSPSKEDYIYLGTTDPKFYGGFQNHLIYKDWQFDILFEFKKQLGIHPIFSNFNLVGDMSNQPIAVLDHWMEPGDHATYEKFTQTSGAAGKSMSYLYNSSALLTDASYCRLKNLSVSYTFPISYLKKEKIQKFRLFIEGQNLFVITGYKGSDPENQSLYQLPPLKKLVMGIQIIL